MSHTRTILANSRGLKQHYLYLRGCNSHSQPPNTTTIKNEVPFSIKNLPPSCSLLGFSALLTTFSYTLVYDLSSLFLLFSCVLPFHLYFLALFLCSQWNVSFLSYILRVCERILCRDLNVESAAALHSTSLYRGRSVKRSQVEVWEGSRVFVHLKLQKVKERERREEEGPERKRGERT